MSTLTSEITNHVPVAGKLSYVSPEDPRWKRTIIDILERMTGRPKITRLYREIQSTPLAPCDIWAEALKKLQVKIEFDQQKLDSIPAGVPLVFIANHPFGVIDGIILGHLLSKVRDEFKVLVNAVLCKQDERLNSFLLPIDFNEDKNAIRSNIATRQEAQNRLMAGGAIGIFPSGGVATATKIWGKAEDLEWKRFTAKLIQLAKPMVVPIYFHGQNSRLFQLASYINPAFRLGLLLFEVRNKMGKTIKIEIGSPISFDKLSHIKDRQLLLDHLKDLTFGLAK